MKNMHSQDLAIILLGTSPRERESTYTGCMSKKVQNGTVHFMLFLSFSPLSICIFNRASVANPLTVLTGMQCASTTPHFCSLYFCIRLGGGPRPLTVCCTGSTGLHPCHNCPSPCLPCSAFHSRTCLTPQPLSEMEERRKHILFSGPLTLSGVPQTCLSTSSWKRTERNLDCLLRRWKQASSDFKLWMCPLLIYQNFQTSAAFVSWRKNAPAHPSLRCKQSLTGSCCWVLEWAVNKITSSNMYTLNKHACILNPVSFCYVLCVRVLCLEVRLHTM